MQGHQKRNADAHGECENVCAKTHAACTQRAFLPKQLFSAVLVCSRRRERTKASKPLHIHQHHRCFIHHERLSPDPNALFARLCVCGCACVCVCTFTLVTLSIEGPSPYAPLSQTVRCGRRETLFVRREADLQRRISLCECYR